MKSIHTLKRNEHHGILAHVRLAQLFLLCYLQAIEDTLVSANLKEA